jgi:hypothetical protein
VGSVNALIGRVLGAQYQDVRPTSMTFTATNSYMRKRPYRQFVQAFILEWIPADPASGNDVFELDAQFGQPVIRGNSG